VGVGEEVGGCRLGHGEQDSNRPEQPTRHRRRVAGRGRRYASDCRHDHRPAPGSRAVALVPPPATPGMLRASNARWRGMPRLSTFDRDVTDRWRSPVT
jgi:hypothetical protein